MTKLHRTSSSENLDIIVDGGEMGKLIRSHDWSKSRLGPLKFWPQSLKTALSICLGSKFPMFIWWGPEFIVFYNDAYIPLAGPLKHPMFLGKPASEQWADIWNVVGPLAENVLETGIATWSENLPLFMNRANSVEETYFTFSYSPVRDESGAVGGVFCAVQETTRRVLGERRLTTLRELGSQEVTSMKAVIKSLIQVLKSNSHDLPFALLYMINADRKSVNLVGAFGIEIGTKAAEQIFDLKTEPHFIDGLRARFPEDLPKNPYEEMPDSASMLPIKLTGKEVPVGFLILGISSRLVFDDRYQDFFGLICRHITNQISNALTLEEERKRSEMLAEIDRTKTEFFSTVSHEFRTPLTLMLAPLEDSLADKINPLLPEQRKRLELVLRNALRLFKLVNSLLDFSRIEAGRMQAVYEPVDLVKLTRELASHFETAMSKAGLEYKIITSPIDRPVFVDREMWEKIILNLLSNAFKFTLKGEIELSLKAVGDHVELTVKDSGIGIPAIELPKISQRFYRIEGSRGRTYEGSGIGLSLIQELVKMHGGSVSINSKVDVGSTFTVKIPFGDAHLPANQLGKIRQTISTAIRTEAFTEEALRWIPEEKKSQESEPTTRVEETNSTPSISAGRILLADDNADMRDYIESLLKPYFTITSVSDGQEAYEEVLRGSYDLVLSDVMMPRLDGFGLVKKLRNNPATKTISIILISARAGEEARIAGVENSADDYLIKPFSGKELVARIKTHIELKRLRDERLKLSEERLKIALVSAQMGAWDWDLKTNRVVRDDVTQKLFGYVPGTFPDTYEAFANALHPEDRERTLELITDAIKKRIVYNADFRIIWPDKSIHWIQGMGRAIYDKTGKPSQMLGIILDITKRKEDEEILKQAILARDEFLTVASHELKTPITSLKMQLQITRRRADQGITQSPEQLIKSIDNSINQVNRLTKLIEEMLDASILQNGKLRFAFEDVNLAALIYQVLNIFSAELTSAKCQVEVDVKQEIIGHWDKIRIEQVLGNLISNAIKYAFGTKIRITAETVGGEVLLIVQDTGPGIPKEKQFTIFERFERAISYRNISGLGLGLYICRQIIEAHGGSIDVESEEGKGTLFVVKLPLFVDTQKLKETTLSSI